MLFVDALSAARASCRTSFEKEITFDAGAHSRPAAGPDPALRCAAVRGINAAADDRRR
jgi:hypothetical protein